MCCCLRRTAASAGYADQHQSPQQRQRCITSRLPAPLRRPSDPQQRNAGQRQKRRIQRSASNSPQTGPSQFRGGRAVGLYRDLYGCRRAGQRNRGTRPAAVDGARQVVIGHRLHSAGTIRVSALVSDRHARHPQRRRHVGAQLRGLPLRYRSHRRRKRQTARRAVAQIVRIGSSNSYRIRTLRGVSVRAGTSR